MSDKILRSPLMKLDVLQMAEIIDMRSFINGQRKLAVWLGKFILLA